jgi:molybdopterin-containing oxidoreductase family iron-sulfur binding subunit
VGEIPAADIDRRSFLAHVTKIGAGALAAAVGGAAVVGLVGQVASGASPATASAESGSRNSRFHYGMVIDTRRCVGCRACVVACKAENKTPPGVYYTVVVDHAIEPRIEDKPLFMTKPCFHCEHPPCVDVCPVSATFKRAQDGIVVVDYDRCIGCRYCMTSCPYSARWFDFGENYAAIAEQTPYAAVPSPEYKQFRVRRKETSPIGNVRKCTFCMHLQDHEGRYDRAAGRWPACAKTCTGHAIHFASAWPFG